MCTAVEAASRPASLRSRRARGHKMPQSEAQLPEFDHARAEKAVRELLLAVGENPDRDGLVDTPARVARLYAELFRGLRQDPLTVLNREFDVGHDEMILVRDIELWSLCEHHLIPFTGVEIGRASGRARACIQ